MAAAVIPLVASLAPELINLIAGLVHRGAPAAEADRGPGTGAVKFADVFVSVMEALTKAKVAGQIAALPDDSAVKIAIQAVVSSMKLTGLLDAPVTASQSTKLKSGESITITAA